LIRIRTESTRVSADHRNLVDLELQHALNVEVHILPLAVVVAELTQTSVIPTLRRADPKYPVTSPFSSRGECRSADQEWTLSGQDRLNSKVCRLSLHEPKQVVYVELRDSAVVRRIGRQGVAVKRSDRCISESHRGCTHTGESYRYGWHMAGC
jgi:hypothetical protein